MSDKTFLDWPFFDAHHRYLAHDLDQWAANHIAPFENEPHDDVDDICRQMLNLMAKSGWTSHAVPKAHGGASENLDVRTLCLIRETLARHSGLADFVFAMQGLGSGAITTFGNDAQKNKWLPRVANGTACAAFALTEPEAGSDVASISTTATRDGDDYIINGDKTFISNGGIADFYTTFARTSDDGARGLSAFIIPANTDGIEIVERINVMAPHPLAHIRFTNCRVPAENLLGNEGDGFKAAMTTLDIFRSTVGAAALGFARRALDEATTRATTRKLFGGTLSDMPVVQSQLADMALSIDASALLIYRAAWTKDQGAERVTREAAMAKLHATEEAQKVIDTALQIFGGMGVVSGHPVEKLYREIRALRIYEGASEVQKLVIARQHLSQK